MARSREITGLVVVTLLAIGVSLASCSPGQQDATAHFNRGVAYSEKGDTDRAIAEYTQAIQLDPKDAQAYFLRAAIYSDKGDTDRAIADYTQAIQLDPKDAQAYFLRAVILTRATLIAPIADYTQAIQLDPKDAQAYYNRALLYSKKGDTDRANADYTQAAHEAGVQMTTGANARAIGDCLHQPSEENCKADLREKLLVQLLR